MRIVSLASGSGGNAYCVSAAGATLLVDCGISCRCLETRCRGAGIDPASISAAVFTHDHADHIAGVRVFAKKHPDALLLANWMTADAIACQTGIAHEAFAVFENGQAFRAGPFEIRAFSVPHDVPDPVGFSISVDGETYFHATDVGEPLDSIGANLAEADFATLEFNHDPVLLAKSDRPEALKRRIRGGRGHLSNDAAAELLRRFATKRLKRLALAHLSRECNEPHLAVGAASAALEEAGLGGVAPLPLPQDRAAEIWPG